MPRELQYYAIMINAIRILISPLRDRRYLFGSSVIGLLSGAMSSQTRYINTNTKELVKFYLAQS